MGSSGASSMSPGIPFYPNPLCRSRFQVESGNDLLKNVQKSY